MHLAHSVFAFRNFVNANEAVLVESFHMRIALASLNVRPTFRTFIIVANCLLEKRFQLISKMLVLFYTDILIV